MGLNFREKLQNKNRIFVIFISQIRQGRIQDFLRGGLNIEVISEAWGLGCYRVF